MQGLNLPRYKKNPHIDGDKVISYVTHVATIDRAAGKLYRHGYWSQTTRKHINYVASYYDLEIEDRERGDKPEEELNYIKNERSSHLKTVAMVAKLGDVFGKNQKESNE